MGSTDGDLADRDAIRELYASYCYVTDLGRPDLFTDAFTDDGVLWLSDRGSFCGKDAIREQVEKHAGKTLHLIHNVSVQRVERPYAWAHAYFHLLDPADGACAAYGIYDDVLRFEGDRWRWYRKRATFMYRASAYVADAALRPDFGRELEGVSGFLENYERGIAESDGSEDGAA